MKNNKDVKIAIVSSAFRPEVSNNLEKNCLAELKKQGVKESQVAIIKVPGSLEIPLTVKMLAKKNIYSAIITFGAIVKGDTYHFEQIADECARCCMNVSMEYEVPVIFEVLAVYNLKDALVRATRKIENKGTEAAQTALSMINILKKI